MTNKELEEFRRKYKEKIKHEYEKLYKESFFGADKISKRLGIPKEDCGHEYFGPHAILQELKKEGFLEQYKRKPGERGEGFRFLKKD